MLAALSLPHQEADDPQQHDDNDGQHNDKRL
jgi:hypothetical protein